MRVGVGACVSVSSLSPQNDDVAPGPDSEQKYIGWRMRVCVFWRVLIFF